MAEFAEGLEGIGEGLELANFTEEAFTTEDFKETFKSEFDAIDNMVSGFSSDIEITGEAGEYKLEYKGKELDMEKYNEEINSENADFIKALDDAGFPDEFTDLPSVKEYAVQVDPLLNERPGIREVADVRQTMENQAESAKEIGKDPVSAEEFEEQVKKNKALEKRVKELEDKTKEDAKKGKKSEVGKWIKRAIGVVGIAALYGMIKQHQDEMNGCWLVSTKGTDGSKCKVKILTCSSDERNAGDPCPLPTPGCGTKDKPESCFTPDTCIKYKPLPSGSPPGTKQECAAKLPQCTSGKCSPYCDCSKVQCPPDHILQCVQVSFWGAAEDFFQKPFDFAGGMAKKIFFILLWVLGGILLVVGISFLIKFIVKAVKKKHEKE